MRVYQSSAVSVSFKITVMDCPVCGVVFGVTDEFVDCRRKDGASFYCPNAHSMSYGESALDKAQRDAARAKARADQLAAARDDERRRREQVERSLAATRGQVTKLRKRAQAGVCPCCTRHFADLQRHMASKHPDIVLEGETVDG